MSKVDAGKGWQTVLSRSRTAADDMNSSLRFHPGERMPSSQAEGIMRAGLIQDREGEKEKERWTGSLRRAVVRGRGGMERRERGDVDAAVRLLARRMGGGSVPHSSGSRREAWTTRKGTAESRNVVCKARRVEGGESKARYWLQLGRVEGEGRLLAHLVKVEDAAGRADLGSGVREHTGVERRDYRK